MELTPVSVKALDLNVSMSYLVDGVVVVCRPLPSPRHPWVPAFAGMTC